MQYEMSIMINILLCHTYVLDTFTGVSYVCLGHVHCCAIRMSWTRSLLCHTYVLDTVTGVSYVCLGHVHCCVIRMSWTRSLLCHTYVLAYISDPHGLNFRTNTSIGSLSNMLYVTFQTKSTKSSAGRYNVIIYTCMYCVREV